MFTQNVINTRGPRLYVELITCQPYSTSGTHAKLIVNALAVLPGKHISISDSNSNLFNFSCPYINGFAHCIWMFTSPSRSMWINMTIVKINLTPLNSYNCTKGVFAVYDKDYSTHDGKLYETCFNLYHSMEMSVISGSNKKLWTILVSYGLVLKGHLKYQAMLSLTQCQGHSNLLLKMPKNGKQVQIEMSREVLKECCLWSGSQDVMCYKPEVHW